MRCFQQWDERRRKWYQVFRTFTRVTIPPVTEIRVYTREREDRCSWPRATERKHIFQRTEKDWTRPSQDVRTLIFDIDSYPHHVHRDTASIYNGTFTIENVRLYKTFWSFISIVMKHGRHDYINKLINNYAKFLTNLKMYVEVTTHLSRNWLTSFLNFIV